MTCISGASAQDAASTNWEPANLTLRDVYYTRDGGRHRGRRITDFCAAAPPVAEPQEGRVVRVNAACLNDSLRAGCVRAETWQCARVNAGAARVLALQYPDIELVDVPAPLAAGDHRDQLRSWTIRTPPPCPRIRRRVPPNGPTQWAHRRNLLWRELFPLSARATGAAVCSSLRYLRMSFVLHPPSWAMSATVSPRSRIRVNARAPSKRCRRAAARLRPGLAHAVLLPSG